MPCCGYENHDRVFGTEPDVAYTDYAIGSTRRDIRVWRDVYTAGRESRQERPTFVTPQSPRWGPTPERFSTKRCVCVAI